MIAVLDDQFEVWWTFFHYMICSVLMLVRLCSWSVDQLISSPVSTCFVRGVSGTYPSVARYYNTKAMVVSIVFLEGLGLSNQLNSKTEELRNKSIDKICSSIMSI
jgi:hypothetical protein